MEIALNNIQKQNIANAIKMGESKTSGEIYCVVAKQSSDYQWFIMILSIIAALIFPLLLVFFNIDLSQKILFTFNKWNDENYGHRIYIIIAIQALIFIFGTLLSKAKFVSSIIPKAIKRQEIHKKAISQFLSHGIAQTEDRTGVMIYVSLAEKMVEILADDGIYKKVDSAVWRKAIGIILEKTKTGDLENGLINGIEEVSKILSEHFPPNANDENELSDNVVFI